MSENKNVISKYNLIRNWILNNILTNKIVSFSWILIKGSPVFRAMFQGPLSPVTSNDNSNSKLSSNLESATEKSSINKEVNKFQHQ